MQKPDEEFARRVTLLRNRTALSQAKTSELIGVAVRTYQRYEEGFVPSHSNLQKLCDYFKCEKAWLLAGMGEPFAEEPEPPAISYCPVRVVKVEARESRAKPEPLQDKAALLKKNRGCPGQRNDLFESPRSKHRGFPRGRRGYPVARKPRRRNGAKARTPWRPPPWRKTPRSPISKRGGQVFDSGQYPDRICFFWVGPVKSNLSRKLAPRNQRLDRGPDPVPEMSPIYKGVIREEFASRKGL